MVKAKVQTIVKETAQRSRRQPRLNLRGALNASQVTLSGNEYNEPLKAAATTTEGVKPVWLAPGNNYIRANAAVNKVGNLFQKGVYLPGTKLTYIPAVGLNTPGNVVIGFVDSPTMMEAYFAKTSDAERLAFIFDLGNVKTGPVWQQMEYPLTQPPRRKMFTVDSTIAGNLDGYDQSVQAMFLVGVFGTTQAGAGGTVVGQLVIHCKTRFEEVKSFSV